MAYSYSLPQCPSGINAEFSNVIVINLTNVRLHLFLPLFIGGAQSTKNYELTFDLFIRLIYLNISLLNTIGSS